MLGKSCCGGVEFNILGVGDWDTVPIHCIEERAKQESKAVNLQVDLCSCPHLQP